MKIIDSDCCTKCTEAVKGDFLHMFWFCSAIKPLWKYINDTINTIIDKVLPMCPILYLIGFNPNILVSFQQKRIILAASTAAKKTIIKNWFEPITDFKRTWLLFFFDVCLLERSTARINNARPDTILNWSNAIAVVQGLL